MGSTESLRVRRSVAREYARNIRTLRRQWWWKRKREWLRAHWREFETAATIVAIGILALIALAAPLIVVFYSLRARLP